MFGAVFLVMAGFEIAAHWPSSFAFALGLGAGVAAGFDLWRVIPLGR